MPVNQFEPLFKDLEGVILEIPAVTDLGPPKWPLRINPHLESIKEEFWSWVHHWFKDEKMRMKIAKLDPGRFASMSVPEAAPEQLLTMAKLIAWYFPWDDAIDDGSLYYKPETLLQYQEDTIAVIQQSLSANYKPQEKPHPNPAIQSFWDIGATIRARGTPATNEFFSWAQCGFVISSIDSQIEREFTEPVTIEQYFDRREKNIAVFPLLALIYYVYQLEIPEEYSFTKNEHMNKMWKLLAKMGTISNDMLSLRREIAHGQFESMVPLLMYHHNLSAQDAMNRAAEMCHECYREFDEVEEEMYKKIPTYLRPTMERYLMACKDLIVCNVHWSYGLKRYMDDSMMRPDGRVVFPIRLPPKDPATTSAATPKSTITISCEDGGRMILSQEKLFSGWPSILRRAIFPIGLTLITIFASQAFSTLRYRWSRR